MIKGAKNSLFYERDNTYQKGQDEHYKKQYFFTYFMSLFAIPRKVGLRLKNIKRDFLLQGGDFGEKTSSSKLIENLDGQEEGGIGH